MPMASEYRGKSSSSQLFETAGIYLLTPAYVNTDVVTGKGDPKAKVCWEAEDGAGSVWDDLAVIEAAAFKWAQLWFAFGEEDQDFPTINDLANACITKLNAGLRVYAKVKMEEWDKKLGPKINCYLSPEEGETILGEAPPPGPSKAPF